MCTLFGSCLAQRLEVSQDVADVNATTNKFRAVIPHVPKNVRPVLADYRDAGQIDDELASPERITGALPSPAEFRSPRFDNSASENELSLNCSVDRRDLEHYSSVVPDVT
jgi:hypothetical protein